MLGYVFCHYNTTGNTQNNHRHNIRASQLTNEIDSIISKSLIRAANWCWHVGAVYVNVVLKHYTQHFT